MLQAVVLTSSAQLLRQITGEFMTLISMEWETDSTVKRPPELWIRSRGRGQECTQHMRRVDPYLGNTSRKIG